MLTNVPYLIVGLVLAYMVIAVIVSLVQREDWTHTVLISGFVLAALFLYQL